MNFNDIMKNIQNNQPAPAAPDDNNNITDFSSEANQSFQDSKDNGLTKAQLDALHTHEASNMWTSLFMNMIGSANGVKDGAKYMEPLNRQTDNERQGLLLQQQMANQQAQRAGLAQKMGLGVLQQNQIKRQQQLSQQPLSNTQKGAMLAYAKQSGQDLDPSDLDNATQDTYDQYMSPLKDVANLGLKQQQIQNMADMYGGRNWVPSTDPKTGIKGFTNKFTREFIPINFNNSSPQINPQMNKGDGTDLKFDGKGKIIGNSSQVPQQEQPLKANNIISGTGPANALTPDEIKGARSQLPKLQADYQKNYGTADTEFNNAYNTVNQLLTESQNGNYKAANSLALQLPRILGGLGKQRITNQEINVENDPSSSGVYNQVVRKIQGLEGNGKVTPQDATFIKESMDALKDQHDKLINNLKNQYRTKAQSLVSKPFNDDEYLFGTIPQNKQDDQFKSDQDSQSQNNSNKNSTSGVKVFNSSDELLKHLGGQ
jgi:hypothetical protein